MNSSHDRSLWNGDKGAGGISWAERSGMGLLRGVIDAADAVGRRNLYMHALHLRVLRNELRKSPPPSAALDFGCGTGRFIKTLATYARYVAATDKEPAMLQAARNYNAGFGAQIVRCDSENVPFESARFDFVLCSSVLCVTQSHLIERIVRELARVMKRGGTLLLLEQAAEARGLSVSRYCEALSAAGLQIMRAYPIRAASSTLTYVASRNMRIPLVLFDLLAGIEIFATKHELLQASGAYVEYAFVARRP